MNERILKKIGHLFALAENNPSEEEAGAALERARALLQEHNLSMSDIRTENPEVDVSGSTNTQVARRVTATWKKNLSLYIADYFDVKCYRTITWDYDRQSSVTRIVYYGIEVNTRAAATALASLIVQVDRLAKSYPGKGPAKTDYRNGLVWGLKNRLTDLKSIESEQCTALAVRSAEIADKWLKDHNIKMKSGSYSSRQRYNHHTKAGERDSAGLQLNPALDGGAR